MSQFDIILGDLGFSPGDDVIDSDLVGEIEYVIGAIKMPPSKSSPRFQTKPGGATLDKPVLQTKPGGATLDKPVLQTKPGGATLDKPIAQSQDAAARLAAANKRILTTQASLRAAARSTLDKASKLKVRADRLAARPASARVAANLSKMSDRLAQTGTQLRKLADKKQLTKMVKKSGPRPTGGKPSPKPAPGKSPVKPLPPKKSLLGAIVEELFGDDAPYDPNTSERDPQTVAEAEAYVKAAQQSYDEAKQAETDAAAEAKRIREDQEGGGTGENPAYDDAIAALTQASLARGDAGYALTYGNRLLADLKDQPPPTDNSGGNPPPASDGGGGGGGGGGGSSSSDTGNPPPSPDTPAPGTESAPPGADSSPPGTDAAPPGADGFPPGADGFPPPGGESHSGEHGYPYGYPPYGGQPDPYAEFADPFAGVPAGMERPTRSAGGGWDDFADSGFDPDSDVEAAERTQMAVSNRATKAAKRRTPALPEPLPEFESTPNEFASDDLPPSEEEVADSEPENEGVVGSYLTGTSVLIGCVF